MFHKFSYDGQYLIIGEYGDLIVYKLICDVSAGEFYNTTSDSCEVCADKETYAMDETGACNFCSREKLFSVGGECFYCNDTLDL